MAQQSDWCYCHKLPTVQKPRGGKLAKCPRCRGDLVVARNTGTKYRLDAGANSAGHGYAWVALAVATVAVAATAVMLAHNPQRQPMPEDRVESGRNAAVETASLPRITPERIGEPQFEAPAADPSASQRSNSKAGPQSVLAIARARPAPPGHQTAASTTTIVQAATKDGKTAYPPHASEPEEMLRAQLLDNVPEVSLNQENADPAEAKEAKLRLQRQAAAIANKLKINPDSFVRDLIESRPDLAGLPWLPSRQRELDSKSADSLQKASLCFRGVLDTAIFRDQPVKGEAQKPDRRHPEEVPADCHSLKLGLTNDPLKELVRDDQIDKIIQAVLAMVPRALLQILAAEKAELRQILVEHLGTLHDASATEALAKFAVFDLNPTVRLAAIDALRKCSSKFYRPVLLEGLRHPWPNAARHAAEALVSLKCTEAIQPLVAMLDEPDPGAPFLQMVQGRKVPMVRELVRVNHLRNCLLCHAPSTSVSDSMRAIVPTPGEPVPGRAAMYHEENQNLRGVTLVRAEVTYLKQDFSVMQPVDNPGVWPSYQRFDYLVRTRPLRFVELIVFDGAKSAEAEGKRPPSSHKESILFALRALTGQNAGPSAEAWQELLLTIHQ